MDQFLTDFRYTIEDGKNRLLAIPAEQARAGEADKWSPKQIIGHLIDSAANNHQRFVRAQFTSDLVCPGYQQDAWVDVQKYNNESWPDLINLWAAYNLHLAHVVSVMDHHELTRSRDQHNLDQIAFKAVDKNTPTTLEYFIRDYVDHLQHHLNQIFDDYADGIHHRRRTSPN
jgi:hypothetical protein